MFNKNTKKIIDGLKEPIWKTNTTNTFDTIKTNRLNKPFNITSICRQDITDEFGEKVALSLSNSEMNHIADKMAGAYCDNGFWVDMKIFIQAILDARKEK